MLILTEKTLKIGNISFSFENLSNNNNIFMSVLKEKVMIYSSPDILLIEII